MRGEKTPPVRRPIETVRTYRETTRIYKHEEATAPKKKERRLPKIKKSWLVISLIVIVVGLAAYYIFGRSSDTLPIPISRQAAQTLGFDIYYPKQVLLPPITSVPTPADYTQRRRHRCIERLSTLYRRIVYLSTSPCMRINIKSEKAYKNYSAPYPATDGKNF